MVHFQFLSSFSGNIIIVILPVEMGQMDYVVMVNSLTAHSAWIFMCLSKKITNYLAENSLLFKEQMEKIRYWQLTDIISPIWRGSEMVRGS